MNLFLGLFQPRFHNAPLWELETDFYLHNPHMLSLTFLASSTAAATAAAIQWDAHVDGLGADPETSPGTHGDWWSAPLKVFTQQGLPRLQVVLPATSGRTMPVSPPYNQTNLAMSGAGASAGLSTTLYGRGGAVLGELLRHSQRVTFFDELLSRPHVAPVLTLPVLPEVAPLRATAVVPRPPVSVSGPRSDAVTRRVAGDTSAIQPEAGLQLLSLRRPAEAQVTSRRAAAVASPKQLAAAGVKGSGAVDQQLPTVPTSITLDADYLISDAPGESLFADVLPLVGSESSLLGRPAPQANVAPLMQLPSTAQHTLNTASATILGAAHAVGSAAASASRRVTATVRGALTVPSSLGADAAGGPAAHVSRGYESLERRSGLLPPGLTAPALTAAMANGSRRLVAAAGQAAAVVSAAGTSIALPPWLVGNPDVVISANGSVTLMKREERMARMRANVPLQSSLVRPPAQPLLSPPGMHRDRAELSSDRFDPRLNSQEGDVGLSGADDSTSAPVRRITYDNRRHSEDELAPSPIIDGSDPPLPFQSKSRDSTVDQNGLAAQPSKNMSLVSNGDLVAGTANASDYTSLHHHAWLSGDALIEELNGGAFIEQTGTTLSPSRSVGSASSLSLLLEEDNDPTTRYHDTTTGQGSELEAQRPLSPEHPPSLSLADPVQYPPASEGDLCAALLAHVRTAAGGTGAAADALPLLGGAQDVLLYTRYAALARTAGMAAAGPPPPATPAPGPAAATDIEEVGAGLHKKTGPFSAAGGAQKVPPVSVKVAAEGPSTAALAAAPRVHILTQPSQIHLFKDHIYAHRPPNTDLDALAHWQGEWAIGNRLRSGPHVDKPHTWLAYPLAAAAAEASAAAHVQLYRRYLAADLLSAPVEPVPCILVAAEPAAGTTESAPIPVKAH
jgi:hypothetical protein